MNFSLAGTCGFAAPGNEELNGIFKAAQKLSLPATVAGIDGEPYF